MTPEEFKAHLFDPTPKNAFSMRVEDDMNSKKLELENYNGKDCIIMY